MNARTLTLVRAVAVAAALLLAAVAIVALPGAALAGLVIGATVGAAVALAPHPAAAGATRTGAGARRAGLTAFTRVCVGWLAVTGLIVLFGPSGWVVALVVGVAIAVPRVAPWIWGPLGGGAAGTGPTASIAEPTLNLRMLSTPQLCEAWQRSYSALLHAAPGPAHDELVRIRGELLDELERRDHVGFARWLEAGARAGSDPSRYLSAGR